MEKADALLEIMKHAARIYQDETATPDQAAQAAETYAEAETLLRAYIRTKLRQELRRANLMRGE